MAVLTALRETPGALLRNPVVLVPVLVLMLFQVPQLVLQAFEPLVASLVSLLMSLLFILVMPFFQAGLLGMAEESLDGRTSLRTFVSEGKSNFFPVLVAYLVLVAVNFAVGFVAFFAVLFGGIAFLGDGGSASLPVLVGVGVVAAVVALAYLLFVFFVQFYGQAIVVDDFGAVEGLKHSVSVVRHNLASTLGYSVLVAVLGGLFGGVYAVGATFVTPQPTAAVPAPHPSLGVVVGFAAVFAVLGTAFGGFFAVYSVAFYRRLTADTTRSPA